MSTQLAIATTAKGYFDTIKVPKETPGEGEVLIKVEYSSLIPFDTYMTDMGYAVEKYPTILGFNASGVVASIGSGVKDLGVGDRVCSSYMSVVVSL
jgi:3-methylcrotonyl-CoA carboxylase alpha subunit